MPEACLKHCSSRPQTCFGLPSYSFPRRPRAARAGPRCRRRPGGPPEPPGGREQLELGHDAGDVLAGLPSRQAAASSSSWATMPATSWRASRAARRPRAARAGPRCRRRPGGPPEPPGGREQLELGQASSFAVIASQAAASSSSWGHPRPAPAPRCSSATRSTRSTTRDAPRCDISGPGGTPNVPVLYQSGGRSEVPTRRSK
jgi:hypothetical protein